MKYDAVIFDFDGTLLYTLSDLRNSVNYALRRHGYAERSLEEIRSFVGNGIRNLMIKALPEGQEASFEDVFADFKVHYAEHCSDCTHPYDGIDELVTELLHRGLKLAIVSNKSDAEVKRLTKKFFGVRFAAAVGEREGIARKPAPDSVFLTLEALGLSRDRAVYVGDSEVDVRTARNAGMDCIAVTWGFRTRHELAGAGATVMIDSPEELLGLI